jgi:hypothetical protein
VTGVYVMWGSERFCCPLCNVANPHDGDHDCPVCSAEPEDTGPEEVTDRLSR